MAEVINRLIKELTSSWVVDVFEQGLLGKLASVFCKSYPDDVVL